MARNSNASPATAGSKWDDMAYKMSIDSSNISSCSSKTTIPDAFKEMLNKIEEGSYGMIANSLNKADFADGDIDISKIETIMNEAEEERNIIRQETKEIMSRMLQYDNVNVSFDEKIFEAMMRDFESETLPTIEENPEFERVIFDFIKLRDALTQYHRNEKKIVQCCNELQREHAHIMVKFRGMFRLSTHDRQALMLVKSKFDKIREKLEIARQMRDENLKTIDALGERVKEKEAANKIKETEIQGLKLEVAEHKAIIDSLTNYMDDDTLPPFIRDKLREYENVIENQREELLEKDRKNATLAADKEEQFNRIIALNKDNEMYKVEQKREVLQRMSLAKEKDDLLSKIKDKDEELNNVQQGAKRLQIMLDEETRRVDEMKTKYDALLSTHLNVNDEKIRIERERNQYLSEVAAMKTSLSEELKKSKLIKDDIVKLRSEKLNLVKAKTLLTQQVKSLTESKKMMTQRCMILKNEKLTFKKMIEGLNHQIAQMKDAVKLANIEKSRFSKKLDEHQKLNQDQIDKILEGQYERDRISKQLNKVVDEKKKKEIEIFKTEKERDSLYQELKESERLCETVQHNLTQKELEMSDSRTKIADLEKKLSRTIEMFTKMKTDRDYYSHIYSESLQVKKQIEKEVKLLKQELLRAEEKYDVYEKELSTKNEMVTKLTQQIDDQRTKLDKSRRQCVGLESVYKAADMRIEKLSKSLDIIESEKRDKAREVENITVERDFFGKLLIQRQKDANKLKEESKLHKIQLIQEEKFGKQKQSEITELRNRLQQITRDRELLSQKLTLCEEIKNEVDLAKKQLNKEKLKSRDLEVELENPVNVHRWRILKGSDPSHCELIFKIQTMQKIILKKSSKINELEVSLKEKDDVISTMKTKMALKDSTVNIGDIQKYQRKIKALTTELLSVSAQRNMYETMNLECSEKVKQQENLIKEYKMSTSTRRSERTTTERLPVTFRSLPPVVN